MRRYKTILRIDFDPIEMMIPDCCEDTTVRDSVFANLVRQMPSFFNQNFLMSIRRNAVPLRYVCYSIALKRSRASSVSLQAFSTTSAGASLNGNMQRVLISRPLCLRICFITKVLLVHML